MSCDTLMPKYVIIALLHVLYSRRNWRGVGVIMLKTVLSCSINITEFRATNILAFFHPNSFTETK